MRSWIPIFVLTALAWLAAPALALVSAPDTVAAGLSDATCPVLALEPVLDAPHVVYVQSGTLVHSWKSGGAWLVEPVANGLFEDANLPHETPDLKVSSAGVLMVLYRDATRLVFAQRVGGLWQADSLDAAPAIQSPSLAISPVTGEPVAAWARRSPPGTPSEIKIARRVGGVWTTQVLDTSSASSMRVAVAVDLADRPRVAWSRPRADAVAARVLTCALASAPNGPFVSAPVDSELAGYVSLAVDPATGDPRLAYNALEPNTATMIRYASLDGGAGWQIVQVNPFSKPTMPPSLAVDAFGNPRIAFSEFSEIEPQGVEIGERSATQCIFIETGALCLWRRAGGTGLGPFQRYECAHVPLGSELGGPRALVATSAGEVAVAWRSPHFNCAPFELRFGLSAPLVEVEPTPGVRSLLQPLAPNPLRLGQPLRVAFALSNEADVVFEVHDAAGRRVTEHAPGRLEAGPHAIHWTPRLARPGLYWLSVRTNRARLGSRAAVVVE